jgi:integrase
MSIFKRGSVYWYHFLFNGEHIQKSTKQGNPRTARQIEAAHRTALAKGEVGIVERKVSPTFSTLADRFIAYVKTRHENKPQTVLFYSAKLSRLREYAPVERARIDRIDEGMIEGYVIARRASVGPATVNRELATLRRMLRLAHEWRLIERVPRIRLLTGERTRDFVLSRKQEAVYLAGCRQPLQDIAIFMLETGLRIGETLDLEWRDVTLKPVNGARFGFIRIREGKSKNAKRIIPLTDRASSLLTTRRKQTTDSATRKALKKAAKGGCAEIEESRLDLVFGNGEGKRYVSTSINHLHRDACAPKINGKRKPLFPADFVLHSLRHTMLTRLGESGVDAFTIMRIAGHSSIVVSQRYIHPTPEAVERAFERLQTFGKGEDISSERQPPATVPATDGIPDAVSC